MPTEAGPAPARPDETGGIRLAHNSLLNLFGQTAPLVVAVVSIPLLISGLGTERFGILTLVWMAIGYFGLFDLGLSRALTQLVAERVGSDSEASVARLATTALILMLALGIIGTVLLVLLSPWLVRSILKVPSDLQQETLHALLILSVSLPAVISTAGLRGILEALHRWDLVNLLRVPLGVLTYLAPLLVLPFSTSLATVVAALTIVRIATWVAHAVLCLRQMPSLRSEFALDRSVLRPLLHFGGWMTVSNIISPLMVYSDRFLVGATVSMTAVAYYVTPYEVVTKLWLLPASLLGVVFPALAATLGRDSKHAADVTDGSLRILFLLLLPPILLLVLFAQEGLDLWLGGEFARNSALVLQLLAIGVFINSLAQVPFTVVQAAGRPDITGKLHLVELPLYLVMLWVMLQHAGIVGAAIAWVLRLALDGGILVWIAARMLPGAREPLMRIVALTIVASGVLVLGATIGSLPLRLGMAAVSLPLILIAGWRYLLRPGERQLVTAQIAGVTRHLGWNG